MRLLVLALAALTLSPLTARAEESGLTVEVDHAKILRIPRQAASVIIGNPSIVDVAIHDANTLVLTGRSYGVTNLVVLDASGGIVVDDSVLVSSIEAHSLRVYRQARRTTYSCAPQCEPKIAIGDEDDSYRQAVGQFATHDARATGGN
ncbi:pilus assembly protein N-terminal domain-containing protein [Aureimonas sp. ME7]|uniref:pilus assembly protein N-terminal domain-containing protein n=1 Tax=Aureimonas sp. ME7 TaxID=2744252 RepID=UPI0015F42F11|nr:pilus assembly protein N-terminal domain-containing protein [Aureimonas sp. ME7]